MSQLVTAGPRVDVATVEVLRERLDAAVSAGNGPVVLDLSAVHTVDATGLAMLLGVERRAAAAQCPLLLRGVPPRVTRILRATGLSRVLRDEASGGIAVARVPGSRAEVPDSCCGAPV